MGRRAKPFVARGLLQFLICDVRDIGSASDDRIDAVSIDVNSRNIESGLTERQRERQADVTQADDAEAGRFGFDPVFKLEISFAFDIDIGLNDCAHYALLKLIPLPLGEGGVRVSRLAPSPGPSGRPLPLGEGNSLFIPQSRSLPDCAAYRRHNHATRLCDRRIIEEGSSITSDSPADRLPECKPYGPPSRRFHDRLRSQSR